MTSHLPADERDGYVLGVDIGTQSSKGILCTLAGRVVAREQRAHATSRPRAGWVEHDAENIWWDDFCFLARRLVPAPAEQVRAVCISGIGPCVLVTDSAGRPLRPAILYGVDTRAVTVALALESDLGGAELLLDRCGSRLSSQSAGPKLAWIREQEPQVWDRTSMFFSAHSYVAHRLTGNYVLDHHTASQYAPLYDRRTRNWIREWSDQVAPGLLLPELRWAADAAGTVSERAARQTGIAAGTTVAVGTVDAWAEAESVDVRQPGHLMLMYGSTMFLIAVTGTAILSPALWSTSGNYPSQHTLAGGMASSGSIISWLRELSGGAPIDQIIAEAAAAPPGASGLLALPYFDGERTPVADPDARGVIAGLTLRHTRGDLCRAILEATAFGVRHNLHAFAEAGFQPAKVVAVGGGVTTALWPQIVADATGEPQDIPSERYGASYGDAKFASVALGASDPDTRWNTVVETVEPSAATRPLLDERYELYHQLRAATAVIQHSLAGQKQAIWPDSEAKLAQVPGSSLSNKLLERRPILTLQTRTRE